MPACGTVTTSPAWRRMLFFVLPASISSNKLTVIRSDGGAVEGPGRPFVDFSCAGADNSGGSVEAVLPVEAEGAGDEGLASAWRGFDFGAAASADPFARPPASARTSRRVIWRSAW